MKPSEQMIEAMAQAICDVESGPLGYFPDGSPMRQSTWNDHIDANKILWRKQACAAFAALLTAARAEGWALCHPEEEISEGMALVGQHTCSEWLNDNAPIGEAMYRSPALATFKDMLRAKLAEEW